MITLSTTDTDAERILKGSALLEAEKQAHKKTALKLDTTQKLLAKFLDEFEGKWDSDEGCESEEIAFDYIDAAKWMANNFDRKGDRIKAVEEWLREIPIGGFKYKF